MKNEIEAWVFLNRIPDLGPIRFHKLLRTAQSAQGILGLPVPGLLSADVSMEVAERWYRAFRDPENWRWLESELKYESRGTFRIKTELDEDYPSWLRELLDRPPVLYYKGKWPIPDRGVVGIVGTRKPSPYGLKAAEVLVAELAVQKVITVSGLARGIDTCVHETTLKTGGHTIAVLGCGLGQIYPKENTALQNQIADQGTVITEFPFETMPDARHFPRRNRIISGLSQGVVVIEAGERSGALITARYAVEQGRDVFAVPGSIFHPTQKGCHQLIKDGAKLVEKASDILEELNISYNTETPQAVTPPPVCEAAPLEAGGGVIPTPDPLTGLEKHIYDLLLKEPLSVDEIARNTSLRFDQVANSLLALELKGIIRNLPGQRYVRNETA